MKLEGEPRLLDPAIWTSRYYLGIGCDPSLQMGSHTRHVLSFGIIKKKNEFLQNYMGVIHGLFFLGHTLALLWGHTWTWKFFPHSKNNSINKDQDRSMTWRPLSQLKRKNNVSYPIKGLIFFVCNEPRPWNCQTCCCCVVVVGGGGVETIFIFDFLKKIKFYKVTLVDNNVATNCVNFGAV